MREGRGITDQGWIDSSVHFNRWLRENADKTAPKITLLDETERTLEEKMDRWVYLNDLAEKIARQKEKA